MQLDLYQAADLNSIHLKAAEACYPGCLTRSVMKTAT